MNKLKYYVFLFLLLHIMTMHALEKNEFWLIRPTSPKGHGFFSTFNLVLGHIYLFEAGIFPNVKGIKVDFGNEGNYYCPKYGSNWWEYYFEPLTLGNKIQSYIKSSPAEANQLAWFARRKLSRNEASKILRTHIRIKPYVLNFVEEFFSNKFGPFTIGVHYRGTDKASEAPRVHYDDVISAIADQINLLSTEDYKIFVATDELPFLEYLKTIFPEKIIATEATRSNDYSNVHGNNSKPYTIGLEALIDAILLSKCNILIRTSSSLSLWSTYYNPELSEILLNNRYGYPAE